MYKPAGKPQSTHRALGEGLKTHPERALGVGEGAGVVPGYLFSQWGERWGVGGKDPRGGANPQGCTGAAMPSVTQRAAPCQAEGSQLCPKLLAQPQGGSLCHL